MGQNLSRLCTFLTVTSLVLGGCAAPPQQSSAPVTGTSNAPNRLTQSDKVISAEHYIELAQQATPPQSHEYHILAADMFAQANDLNAANHWLNQVPQDTLSPRLTALRAFALAKIQQRSNDSQAALTTLRSIQGLEQVPASLKASILSYQANLYDNRNQILEAAELYSTLAVMPSQKNRGYQDRVWRHLSDASDQELRTFLDQNPTSQFSGWVELAYLLRTQKLSQLDKSLYAWEQTYPNHPGKAYTNNLRSHSKRQSYRQTTYQSTKDYPKQIALFLPLSGTHKQAAEAIRDGFLTRYYAEQSANKPNVKIYDTSTAELTDLYTKAIHEGADFVVGPLMKENVLEISRLRSYQVKTPILALNENQSIQQTPRDFYQYSLAPESEAKQIAIKAYRDGYRNAAIIVPKNTWGKRVVGAFSQQWQSMGGHLVNAVKISGNEDQAKATRRLLNVDSSQERSQMYKYSIREKVDIQPRRRQDVDVIMMAAPPEQARQLKPLLNFYFAHDLPVYSTSSVYAGSPTPSKDKDMNGVKFCDMPWLLDASAKSRLAKESIETHWPETANMYSRLFAMGIDAFELTGELTSLSANPKASMQGATGYIYVTADNRVERKLVWAKFESGVPKLIQ